MAGWDHEFDVDPRDRDLVVGCFRIWRRTCARYFIEFTYQHWRDLPRGRVQYLLAYDARTTSMPPAVAEFAVEMRAVSMIQLGRRRKHVPLRLLRDVAFVNVPFAVEDELDASLVPARARQPVTQLLTDTRSALLAFRRGEAAAADILDTLHSCVLNLALLLAPGARQQDKYPTLVDKLRLNDTEAAAMKKLGTDRNKVKHRGERNHADAVLLDLLSAVWSVVHRLTGVYLESVSPEVMALVEDDAAAFRLPPMYTRLGEPRTTRR